MEEKCCLDACHFCNLINEFISYFISTPYYFLLAGYAFVYFEDERDAEDAIHALDNSSFGYGMRKLSVEWDITCKI
ncbi:putative RNA recognition motif domain, nucleotide-binding alpha-beta plait domain superfamily [Helianthus annuus]|nr:putative RNA recognition motif domain, nucleotide-binding alpha-beta plait domain superfamily [Helianthus annuus]